MGSYIVQPSSVGPSFPSTTTPAFVQAKEAHTTGGPTSFSVSFTTLPVVGDIAIVGIGTNGNPATDQQITSVVDNQGNSYVRLLSQPVNNGSVQKSHLFCGIVASSSGTFTITASVFSNALWQIFALEYSSTTCNPDNGAGALTNTSPYSCGSVTTRNAHDLLLSLLFSGTITGTITYTPPTGFTTRASQVVAANGQGGAIADNILSATNTFTPTWAATQNISSTPCIAYALLSR